MSPGEFSGPDLAGVVADANDVGLAYVVIGGFSVIANGYVRATNDSDLLVPDGADSDAAIMRFLVRAEAARLRDGKRLAGRPRDRNDLEELEAFHGELPIEPIPGLDD
jgi:hypothetical protein